MLQAVLLDYDGTIAPTSERQENWFKFYSKKNSKRWRFKTIDKFLTFYNLHCSRPGGVQNVYDELDLPCEMGNRRHPVWPAYEEFNQKHPMKLYSGIKKTIKEIWKMGSLTKNVNRNRRLRLGINTTNSWKSIYKDIERGGILPYFDCFITEEILRKYHGADNPDPLKKPSTISLALILGLIDSEGAYTLHVGDTLNDLRASQKVMRLNPMKPETLITVGACYGYEGRKVLEKGIQSVEGHFKFDYLIDKPSELVTIVKTLLED